MKQSPPIFAHLAGFIVATEEDGPMTNLLISGFADEKEIEQFAKELEKVGIVRLFKETQ